MREFIRQLRLCKAMAFQDSIGAGGRPGMRLGRQWWGVGMAPRELATALARHDRRRQG